MIFQGRCKILITPPCDKVVLLSDDAEIEAKIWKQKLIIYFLTELQSMGKQSKTL